VKRVAGVLLLLYVVALHTSMAGMEMFSWALFLVVVADRAINRKKWTMPLRWPLLALLACVGAGLVLNPALKPAIHQFGFMRWVFLFWMFIWAFEWLWSKEFEQRLVKVWFSVCALLALYALVQFVTGLDLRLNQHRLENEGSLYRSAGFFVNCLTFAYVMGGSYFAIAKPASERLPKWAAGLFVAAGFGAIVSSMARGALLASLVTAFIYIVFQRRKWLPYFTVGAVAALIVLSSVWGKLGSLIQLRLDGSSYDRLHLWNAYLNMFFDKPLFGVGLFQGDKLLPEYYAREGFSGQFYSHAHNVWLQWLGGAGAPALMLFLYISAMMLKWAWELRELKWGWPLLLSHLYIIFGGMTEATFFDGEVNHLIVFLWAMTAFLRQRSVQEIGKI